MMRNAIIIHSGIVELLYYGFFLFAANVYLFIRPLKIRKYSQKLQQVHSFIELNCIMFSPRGQIGNVCWYYCPHTLCLTFVFIELWECEACQTEIVL